MEKIKNNEMENMNLRKLSIKMSIPMVISMISLALYNLIDSIFVANIGNEALTAISLSFPFQAILTAIALGTGIGINSLISRKLGEKKEELVNQIISHSILLGIICYLIVMLFCLLFINKTFGFFTNNKTTLEYGVQYLSICLIFSFGLIFQIIFEKIAEAFGKSLFSMIIQFSGAVINLILDPLLIYGYGKIPSLGIKGAAIATVIGQISGMIIGVFLLRKVCMKHNIKNMKFDRNIVKDIYIVGFPSIITESLSAFVTLILNKILTTYSVFAVPFWGIYNKVQSFIFMIVYGFDYGMIPIVGYNYGAKNYKRMKETIKIFICYAEIIMIMGVILFAFMGGIIFKIYKADDGIVDIGIFAFRVLCIGFIFAGISLPLSSVFQAIGKGTYSMIIFLIRQFIINVPVIFLLRNTVNINVIWFVFIFSEFVAMAISYLLYKKETKLQE